MIDSDFTKILRTNVTKELITYCLIYFEKIRRRVLRICLSNVIIDSYEI